MAVVPLPNGTYFLESRKRPLKDPVEFIDSKRERPGMEDNPSENGLNAMNPPPGQLLLKVLIPGYAAGAVIGKGGQIIVQLQKDSGAIIKLSKAKDFYPGTQDRVVLIQGTADGLMKVNNTIVEKVFDFPVPKDLAALIGDRPKQVKIIVPHTTAGLVIGKAGATVRTIMDESGAKIQLSQKPEGVNVQERVITIKGDKHQLITASNIIIDKIKDDPQSASCPNISYSAVSGPIANANPTGSPYAIGAPALIDATHPAYQTMLGHYVIPGQPSILHTGLPASHYIPHHHHHLSAISLPANDLSSIGNGLCGLNGGAYGLNYAALNVVPGVQSNLPAGIATSLGVLPASSLTGGASTVQPSSSLLSAAALSFDGATGAQPSPSLSLPSSYLASLMSAGYITPGHQLVGTPAVSGSTVGNLSHVSPSVTPSSITAAAVQSSPALPSGNSIQSPVNVLSIEKSNDGLKETIELAIPETLIGAILGKAGRTLIEYQDLSGAKIQISKKGDYVAGTRNRRVSITGRPSCSQTAQLLISQRIVTAHTARLQQAKVV